MRAQVRLSVEVVGMNALAAQTIEQYPRVLMTHGRLPLRATEKSDDLVGEPPLESNPDAQSGRARK